MADYRPQTTFTNAMELLTATVTNVNGVRKKTYAATGTVFFGSFKTYGGTERDVNGVYSIEDTADIESWFNPAITSEKAVKLLSSGAIYEIINEPENINMRNQFIKFKVRRIKGGV